MAALIQFASGAPGIKYTLDKPVIIIGRGTSGTDICLPCAYASKRHATIVALPSLEKQGEFTFYIEDMGSKNSTYVNDKAIKRIRLYDGDVIRIGRVTLKFDASGENSFLEAVELDNEPMPESQSSTMSFSRRLSLFE
jgi:adenylate cyclase